jgi:AraC-like DNA-binding protein
MLVPIPADALRCVHEACRTLRAQRIAAELERPRLRVATWLTPRERMEVDAASHGRLQSTHCATLSAVHGALLNDDADAVLISGSLIDRHAVDELSALVSRFPAVLFTGLTTEADRVRALSGAQMLGNAGVRLVIDSRTPGGWGALRETLNHTQLPDRFMREALSIVLADIEQDAKGDEAPRPGCRRFFQAVLAPHIGTAGELASQLSVRPPTLLSRFARAGLPSPRQYLTLARLVWAARLAESPGLTIAAISLRLGASSPQSFGRTLKRVLGVTGTEFRSRFTGYDMLDRFRRTLIMPYRDILREFDPASNNAGTHWKRGYKAGQGVTPCR